MNILNIAYKDFLIFIKDRSSVLNQVLQPMLFIIILSIALAPLFTPDDDSKLILNIADHDQTELSARLIEELEYGGLSVNILEEETALSQLEEGEISRLLIIPDNFAELVNEQEKVSLDYVLHENANETNSRNILEIIQGSIYSITLKDEVISGFRQMAIMQGYSEDNPDAFPMEEVENQVNTQMEASSESPLIEIVKKVPETIGDTFIYPNIVEQNVPGYALIFVFGISITTAYSLHKEKMDGTFRRILSAPVSKASLLLGKMLNNFIIALIQIIIIFAISILVLPLLGLEQLSLGNDLLALTLLCLMISLTSTGFGVFLASITRNANQVSGFGTLLMWTMGAVGGCLFPGFLLTGFLGMATKIVPHSWALNAFQTLIVRGGSLAEITTELLVLGVFSLIFFFIGLWRFRFE